MRNPPRKSPGVISLSAVPADPIAGPTVARLHRETKWVRHFRKRNGFFAE
jgi:hypothetical protein